MRGGGTRGGRRGGPRHLAAPPRAVPRRGRAPPRARGWGGRPGPRGGFSLPRGAGAARRAPPRGLGGGGGTAPAGPRRRRVRGRYLRVPPRPQRGRAVSSPPAGCGGGKSFPNRVNDREGRVGCAAGSAGAAAIAARLLAIAHEIGIHRLAAVLMRLGSLTRYSSPCAGGSQAANASLPCPPPGFESRRPGPGVLRAGEWHRGRGRACRSRAGSLGAPCPRESLRPGSPFTPPLFRA